MWRPIQPVLNNYRTQEVRQSGTDTSISTVSQNFQQCCAGHFDVVGCQNYYCQIKYIHVYLILMVNVYKR